MIIFINTHRKLFKNVCKNHPKHAFLANVCCTRTSLAHSLIYPYIFYISSYLYFLHTLLRYHSYWNKTKNLFCWFQQSAFNDMFIRLECVQVAVLTCSILKCFKWSGNIARSWCLWLMLDCIVCCFFFISFEMRLNWAENILSKCCGIFLVN